MKKNYTRFSLPGRIVDLLYCDDEFYRYVTKNKKAKETVFPKYNTYRNEGGFHMVFALAGYSSNDVNIESFGDELIISSPGVQDAEQASFTEDSPDNAKSSVQHGYIVRGIARRRFAAKFQISNLFDITQAGAVMKDGELHITIPECDGERRTVEINYISDEG
jgi:HSP20 family molecular chaperone IbpA